VLHCGDFGFYSEERLEELPDRELALRIRHSEKLRHLKNKAFAMTRQEKIGSRLSRPSSSRHTRARVLTCGAHRCCEGAPPRGRV
jgi:hypothetical protein